MIIMDNNEISSFKYASFNQDDINFY